MPVVFTIKAADEGTIKAVIHKYTWPAFMLAPEAMGPCLHLVSTRAVLFHGSGSQHVLQGQEAPPWGRGQAQLCKAQRGQVGGCETQKAIEVLVCVPKIIFTF